MTTTNSHFASKEHYLAFRKAWSNAVNSDKAKTHYEERTYTHGNSHEVYKHRVNGWLTGVHHVLFNILRGKPFHHGFTMVSNRNKLSNGTDPSLGLGQAVATLKRVIDHITNEAKHDPKKTFWFQKKKEEKPYWGTEVIDTFLAPFDGTVDRTMLLNIKVPEVKTMYTTYGKDKKVVDKMLSGEIVVRTYEDLVKAREEV